MNEAIIVIGIGGVLFVIGIIGLVTAKLAARKVRVMTATKTSRISDLLPEFEAVRAELGGETSEMRRTVELKGTIACDAPIVGELSQQQAAMVKTEVSREVEVLRRTTDDQGRTHERWVQQTEQIHSTRLEAPFDLDDGSGRVRIRPDGASLELTKVVDRFEQPGAVEQSRASVTFGSFSLQLSGVLGAQKRVIGYRFEESILPLGAELYVLGELSDTGDGLAVRDSDRSDRPFIVSTKGEEALVRSGKSTTVWGKRIGIGGLAIGTIVAAVGVVMAILG